MPKDKFNLQTYFQRNLLAVSVQVVAIIVLILNLWLACQLSPVREDLAILAIQVEQNSDNIIPRAEIEIQLIEINRKLANIEEKLDSHIINK